MENTILLVKNLPPPPININEIFSAYKTTSIKPFGRRRVLLSFENPQYAYFVLHQLHQSSIRGRIISVEYHRVNKDLKNNADASQDVPTIPTFVKKLYSTSEEIGFHQPPPPYLKYAYPKINNDILDSISIALMSNSRFYTQVLHLMNRMNVDPPFGPKGSAATRIKSLSLQEIGIQTDPVSFESDIESELESDSEKMKSTIRKRKLNDKGLLYRNKAKKVLQVTCLMKSQPRQMQKRRDLSSVFDLKKPLLEPKIVLKVDKVTIPQPKEKLIPAEDDATNKDLTPLVLPLPFVPPEDLITNRIPLNQIEELPIFKNYEKGQLFHKLYVKNLHKDVTESDLRSVYERFTPTLGIDLMQKGRMKGQAFITFKNLESNQLTIVEEALNATNGFILRSKPMVVCFAKKQLGLLETIYVDAAGNQHSSRRHKMQKLAIQPFDYVIAVDFEATCWENIAPPKWRESEIIEFPAILVNLKTGKIEAEFHEYIMPIESPKLSAFCTELTGITQKTVDTGMPLQTALMMFQEWLRKELRARNLHLPKMSKDNKIGNCAFVTWSDWDFGICLAKECQRKRLKKPQFFNQWIDLRALFREWYNYKPINFSDALQHVGLEFEGREHSGIDDAKNLAALACKMVNDGASLAITKDLTPFQLNVNFG